MKETIGIKRLDHVCWAVHKLDEALPLLTELFGMRLAGRWENQQEGYRGVSLEVPGGTAHFELLEALGDDTFLARFLRERGPGLHHVTFEVEDVDRAAGAIRGYGLEPFRGVLRSHGWAETYIHPKDSGGVLFQFYREEDHHHEREAPKSQNGEARTTPGRCGPLRGATPLYEPIASWGAALRLPLSIAPSLLGWLGTFGTP